MDETKIWNGEDNNGYDRNNEDKQSPREWIQLMKLVSATVNISKTEGFD